MLKKITKIKINFTKRDEKKNAFVTEYKRLYYISIISDISHFYFCHMGIASVGILRQSVLQVSF